MRLWLTWCDVLGHAWGKRAQGEMSEQTRNMLIAVGKMHPPGTVFVDAVTPWFHTCKRCGKTEQT